MVWFLARGHAPHQSNRTHLGCVKYLILQYIFPRELSLALALKAWECYYWH
jgi:hypothetical protein